MWQSHSRTIGIVIVMILFMGACVVTADDKFEINLRVYSELGPEAQAWLLDHFIPSFEEKNKIAVVILDPMSFRGVGSRIAQAADDVDVLIANWNPTLEEKLAPLGMRFTRWVDRVNFFTSLMPVPVESMRFLPFGVSLVRGKIYNPVVFSQFGLDPERPPATWNELLTAARKATMSYGNDMSTIGFYDSNWSQSPFDSVAHFIYEGKGGYLSDDFRRILINDSIGTAALELAIGLYGLPREHGQNPTIPVRYDEALSHYAQNRYAMWLVNDHLNWFHNLLMRSTLTHQGDLVDNHRFFVSQPVEGRDSFVQIHPWVVGISRSSHHQNEAWQFIEDFLASDVMNRVNMANGTIPARIDAIGFQESHNPFERSMYNAIQSVKFANWYIPAEILDVLMRSESSTDPDEINTRVISAFRGENAPNSVLEWLHGYLQEGLDRAWQSPGL